MTRLRASWNDVLPLAALVALALVWGRDLPGGLVAVVAVVLGGAVLAAVHHGEVVAQRTLDGRAWRWWRDGAARGPCT